MGLAGKNAFMAALAATDCPICLDILKSPLRTDCCHVFCLECARTWFATSSTCPSCSAALYEKPTGRSGHREAGAANTQRPTTAVEHVPGPILAPDRETQEQRTTIRVLGPWHEEVVYFLMKRTTPMERLMNAFSERSGESHLSLRFVWREADITWRSTATPDELGLEDGDTIKARLVGMVEW
ncbi:hypothetical protein CLAFUW4_08150 [Fulvia fulva]|uniref:RING-type domain-containing protein n=1 Tax=Passalora fulva TaxID=5499 RepID=A0A9Q8P6Z8_PASFU|nr:uncharacterized protein CLAFUR5_08264 [Fulvia fulva]KAK4629422.1 hypothetical protein CLAFUR4_08155 [Fulvia fulva]KAK4630235.1 hypothetical protein CLAFUR0_08150 [Fulvia fulva]UJO15538.1 hypothetical protein CLAFUR5_08264 [Fulvia fulva]WPV12643.1 hypothetical protein CLAFUW4_08150 [Fulvia fulva]WPV27380.1 hypothetical protein CLAFUW7_08150 [Fulvia fulva]